MLPLLPLEVKSMIDTAAQDGARAYIVRLEEALAEYALRYGLTERARVLFQEGATTANRMRSERGMFAAEGSEAAKSA